MLKKTLGALALTSALVATQSAADGHQIDLSGKTVEWVIPFSETGGSAKWANFFAPLLSEALPGNPTVVVKFMPGAGSTKGANFFQSQTYEDGTLIFGSSGSTFVGVTTTSAPSFLARWASRVACPERVVSCTVTSCFDDRPFWMITRLRAETDDAAGLMMRANRTT